jgi:uncharacterized protein (UPF0548 family)
MFLITKPTEDTIRHFIKQQKGGSFSYDQVGSSRNASKPSDYTADHNREQIGEGRAAFERAKEAIKQWKMFDLSFTELYFDNTPIEAGQTVAILIRHFGFWSLNAARIVYTLDESTNDIEKFGFAYGTLTEHGERGEERFSVEYHKADESVWYDLYAFSKPNHILAKIGYPLSRYLQKEFARQSKLAMKKAV